MPKLGDRRTLTNSDLPAGVQRTPAGHLRYSAPKQKRGKYVHRDMVEKLIEETPWSVRLMLPWPYEVHHLDWNKEHNEAQNFLIVSEALHSAITASGRKRYQGRFHPKWRPPPDWVLFDAGPESGPESGPEPPDWVMESREGVPDGDGDDERKRERERDE